MEQQTLHLIVYAIIWIGFWIIPSIGLWVYFYHFCDPPKEKRPFEIALRLTLELHEFMENGDGNNKRADAIRDELDVFVGWCNPDRSPEKRLTADEKDLLERVSVALYNDK
jgi:hypothetical protein